MRKIRTDGKLVTVFEPGDGIRRKFREALSDERYLWPRKGLVHHEESWYVSGAPLIRPLFGVYAMAAFAEDLLWRARFGSRMKPDFKEVNMFYAETRRALQNVLSTYNIDRRLTKKERISLRKVVSKLALIAARFVHRTPVPKQKPKKEDDDLWYERI